MRDKIQFTVRCWASTDAFLLCQPAEALSVSPHICLLLSDGYLRAFGDVLPLDSSHMRPTQSQISYSICVFFSVSSASSDRFSFGHLGWLGDAISKQGSYYLNMQQLWALEPIWNNGNHFLSESRRVHSYLFWLLSCQVRVKQAWQGFVQHY